MTGMVWWVWWSCSAPELPGPRLDRVEPSFAYNGTPTAVSIHGEALWPRVVVDARTGQSEVDRDYEAWLVGPDAEVRSSPLVGASALDTRTLAATVPAGLTPGVYDLVVQNSTGAQATLGEAFTVTAVAPARLELRSLDVVTVTGDTIEAEVFLLDQSGALVEVDVDVRFTATLGPPQDGTAQIGTGTLADPVVLDDRVLGRLTDGQAMVTLSSALPGTVTLSVEAVDPDLGVVGDTLLATFLAGGSLVVDIDLPPGIEPVFRAGDAVPMTARLVDEVGNPLDLAPILFLGTDCSGWFGAVAIDGVTPFEVIPKQASNPACPLDRVRAVYGATGESDPFEVVAGAATQFNVVVERPSPIVAGTVVDVTLSPVDAFGNPAPWIGDVTLSDSVGGAQDAVCAVSGGGDIECLVTVVRAGTEIVLTARGSDGTLGTSAPYTVVAADEPVALTLSVTGPAVAGEALPVQLLAFDPWDNPISAANLGASAFTIADVLGESQCSFTGFAADGSITFDCLLFTAGGTALAGSVQTASGTKLAIPVALQVVNGPLATVELDGEGTKVAGAPFVLVLTGRDAWGNLYLTQSDPHVDLRDDSGTYSQTGADFGAAGTVSVSGSITRAGLTTVRASQGGIDLGTSEPILVLAGSPSALALTPGAPWAWVDEPLPVQVEVVDAYGNRADGDLTATLTSTAGAPSVPVSVVNGIGEGLFVWPLVAQPDLLTASGNGWVGQVAVTVSERCASGGPTLGLTFGGYPEAVACLDAAGEALVSADLSSSAAGEAPIATYALAEPRYTSILGTSPTIDVVLAGSGPHDLWALVVDEAGCGDELRTTAWAGPDDGTPVGRVPLVASAASLGIDDTVTVDVVGVTDCARDPAASEVFVRTTAGTLGSVVETGEGLLLTLDNAGNGAMTITTAGGLSGGTIEVHATVASGAAGGFLELLLDGDDVRPVVVRQTPAGPASGVYGTATLVFSEPMLASGVAGSSFSVLGPAAVSVSGAQLLGAGDVVEVSFSPAVDVTADTYTLVATTALRDLAGNRLSGDWSGAAAEYRGAFGAVGAPPAAVTCTGFDPVGLAFRPDGDDGADEQADMFEIDLAAASAPAYWVVSAWDAEDQLVWQGRFVPLGASDTVSWAGRGFGGLVVPPGSYALEVVGDNGLGTASDGCAVFVSVMNTDARPPWERP